jgi:hypothetical protein
VLTECYFNLSQLDAMSTQLDLLIDAPENSAHTAP